MLKDGWTIEDAEAVLAGTNEEEIARTLIWITMSTPDPVWSQEMCIRFARHENQYVRGNAVLGFAHLARTNGDIDRKRVSPIVAAALSDPSPFVRGHAENASDDIAHYLGWPRRDAG